MKAFVNSGFEMLQEIESSPIKKSNKSSNESDPAFDRTTAKASLQQDKVDFKAFGGST